MGWNPFRRKKFTRSEIFSPSGSEPDFTRISDENLIKRGYIHNPDAYSIISRIAEKGATTIDYKLMQEQPNGELEEVIDGDVYDAFFNPNTEADFIEDLIEQNVNLLASGDLFIWSANVVIGRSYFTLSSADVEIITEGLDGDNIKHYEYENNGKTIIIPKEDMIHIKYVDPLEVDGDDQHRGLSPLQAAYKALDASNQLYHADKEIMKNKGAIGLISNEDERSIDGGEIEELEKALQKKIGGSGNYGKIAISSGKFKYQQIGLTPKDMLLTEQYITKLRQLCNVYKVDSSLFNDPDNKTFNNRKEASKAMYNDAVIPLMQKINSGKVRYYNEHLRDPVEGKYFINMSFERVPEMQEDANEKAEKNQRISNVVNELNIGIQDGSHTFETAKFQLVKIWDISEEDAETLLIANPVPN